MKLVVVDPASLLTVIVYLPDWLRWTLVSVMVKVSNVIPLPFDRCWPSCVHCDDNVGGNGGDDPDTLTLTVISLPSITVSIGGLSNNDGMTIIMIIYMLY